MGISLSKVSLEKLRLKMEEEEKKIEELREHEEKLKDLKRVKDMVLEYLDARSRCKVEGLRTAQDEVRLKILENFPYLALHAGPKGFQKFWSMYEDTPVKVHRGQWATNLTCQAFDYESRLTAEFKRKMERLLSVDIDTVKEVEYLKQTSVV